MWNQYRKRKLVGCDFLNHHMLEQYVIDTSELGLLKVGLFGYEKENRILLIHIILYQIKQVQQEVPFPDNIFREIIIF